MPKHVVSYLASVRFDPKLWNHWWAKYITQIRLVLILIFTIVVLGIFGYINIPRRLNPEINIAIVIVNTSLPGASPEDVEQLITIPLEDEIKGVEGIDTMTSTSVDSNSTITLQFKAGVNGDKARDDVKSAADSVTTLPTDATTPSVRKLDFEDQPVWSFAITTQSDTASLMRFSKLLKDRIEALTKVDRVVLSGFDDQDVEVILDPEKIAEFGLTPPQVASAIQKAASSYPAGTLQTTSSSFSLVIDRDITTVDDIRNTRITVAGQNLKLGDIARVMSISKSDQNKALLASAVQKPTDTVQFFVYKTKTENIDVAEKDVHTLVDKTIAQYHGKFTVTTITNNAQEIEDQFNDLNREFSTTVLLVFILLLLFLGLRQALISSITVPLTFLASFAVIYALGLSLNFLTTFSFLIALGVLIDDAIVVVAAMTRYYGTGRFTQEETGVLVWRDFIVPLVSTAITTVWAFVPLLLAGGIIGEFIKTIPLVVTVTMIVSTMIALLINLPLMLVFLKPEFPTRVKVLLGFVVFITPLLIMGLLLPRSVISVVAVLILAIALFIGYRVRKPLLGYTNTYIRRNSYLRPVPGFIQRVSDRGLLDIEVLSRAYMRVIDRILISKHGKRDVIIAILVFTMAAYLLVPFGFVKNEFFPKEDSNLLYIAGELPPGTNLTTSSAVMTDVVGKIKDTDQVQYIVAETGAGFNSGMGRTSSGNSFLLTLHLTDAKARDATSSDIAEQLRTQLKNYPKAKVTIQEQSGGPPAGADVQITLLGDDLTILDQYANKTIQFLQKQPGVTNIAKSIKPGTSKLVFVLDKDKLAENNLTVDQVSLWLRTYASGFKLDSVKFGNEKDKEDIVFRLSTQTQTPENLGRIAIPVQAAPAAAGQTAQAAGSSVPLLSLGSLKLATNPTIITREKGKRTMTVTATVVAGYNAQEVNQKLTKYADTGLALPEGYSWQTGGANEENQKSVQSILEAMVLSAILIFVTMVIEFRSFRQTLIALLFIPLSISGVFYVFALTSTPLSFPALIGVLALFGIVVRHAIVVIEKVNDDLKEGMTIRQAVVDAAGNRLEPVLLTSLAAIVGLIPITVSNPLWRGLGGAIIAGLLFSGAIKLFFVPVTFFLMFGGDKQEKAKSHQTRRKVRR